MRKEITSIIVDDELGARQTLTAMLNRFCPEVKVLAEYSSVADALPVIYEQEPQLIFLDVEMPGKSGLELAASIEKVTSKIIFTTAYSQYALKAIKVAALDYLLKPIDALELRAAVDRYHELVIQAKPEDEIVEPSINGRIAVPSNEGFELIKIADILYCEAASNYTQLYSINNKVHIASKTLKEYEDMLPASSFCRVHQSYLVNMTRVEKFVKGRGGILVLESGKSIPVSQNKRVNLNRFIGK